MSDPLAPLIPRIAAGERDAFADLYRATETGVFRFIRSRLNDPFGAADILHDTYMDVWKGAATFEGRSKVTTWIMGIAHRKVIDAFRRGGRTVLTNEVPETEDDTPDAEACLAASEEAEHVRHCLETLKDDHRTAINLAFYEDMTYGQIAEITGAPEGTIKTRVFHAKKLLLRCLAGLIDREVRS